MKISLKTIEYNKSLDSFFILLLLCIFAFGSLFVVIFSIDAYQNISDKMNNNFKQITPLSYVASKVRQSDTSDSIKLEDKEGLTALVIKSEDNNEICETWIYNYDGYIYEIYISEGTEFSLSDGNAIFENNKIEFSIINNNLLSIYIYNEDNISMNLTLALRSSFERGLSDE